VKTRKGETNRLRKRKRSADSGSALLSGGGQEEGRSFGCVTEKEQEGEALAPGGGERQSKGQLPTSVGSQGILKPQTRKAKSPYEAGMGTEGERKVSLVQWRMQEGNSKAPKGKQPEVPRLRQGKGTGNRAHEKSLTIVLKTRTREGLRRGEKSHRRKGKDKISK